jgi:ADP-heptose:LPS heptosyltransferase
LDSPDSWVDLEHIHRQTLRVILYNDGMISRGAANSRPLIVRCGAFGDMVLLTALIRPLHQRFAQPVDIVTSGPWSEPLLRGQPGVGDIYRIRSRKTPYWLSLDQQRLVRNLQQRGLTATWFCDGNDSARPLLDRAGIPPELIVVAKEHDLRPGEHATEQWRRLGQLLPSALPADSVAPFDPEQVPAGCYLQVFDAQRQELSDWLSRRGLNDKPLLAIQMGNKRTMRRGFKRLATNHKYWPEERWAEVLRQVHARHPGHAILLLGTGPEFALNEEVGRLAALPAVHNVADDLAIPRLVALLERAEGLINVDSGPAHAAAAVGCPQVVLFGKASPALYRPFGVAGADVKVLTGEVDGMPNMLGISTQAVIEAWDGLRLRRRP